MIRPARRPRAAGADLALQPAHQPLDGDPVGLARPGDAMVRTDRVLRRDQAHTDVADGEHVVLIAHAPRVDLDHDHALLADHAHAPVGLDDEPGFLAQAEAARYRLLGTGDDQAAEPMAAEDVLVDDPGVEQAEPRLDQQAGMGIVGRHAVAQRVLAAAAGDHQRRQGGRTAAGGDDGGAALPGRDQRLEDRRLLAAKQEAVDQPALIAAGDEEAVEPGDALDQGLAAGLAAQPVARGTQVDRADPVPLEQGDGGLGRDLRLRGCGGDHAQGLGDELAQLCQQRVAGAQRAAEQDEAPARGLGRAAQGAVAVVLRTARRPDREPQIEAERRHAHALVGVLEQRLGAPAAADLDRDLVARRVLVGPGGLAAIDHGVAFDQPRQGLVGGVAGEGGLADARGGPEVALADVDPPLGRPRVRAEGGEIEAVAPVEVAELEAGELGPRALPGQPAGVDMDQAALAEHGEPAVGHHHGGVLVDAEAVPPARGHQCRDQATEPAALQEVLVDQPEGKKPRPRPMLRRVSCGSAASGWASASTELPLVIIGSLITAAPALLPAITPPAAWARRIAARAGVSTPSWISALTISDWSPPVK